MYHLHSLSPQPFHFASYLTKEVEWSNIAHFCHFPFSSYLSNIPDYGDYRRQSVFSIVMLHCCMHNSLEDDTSNDRQRRFWVSFGEQFEEHDQLFSSAICIKLSLFQK